MTQHNPPPHAASKPLWHGIILVAGGAVGAGMFALPMVSAGAWALWSLLGLTLVWWFTYKASILLLETNLTVLDAEQTAGKVIQGPPRSFDTLVKRVLGHRWAAVNNVSLVFIMMILMYAYTSAGASIIGLSLERLSFSPQTVGLSKSWLSAGFAALIALFIWVGTALVARISMVLMAVMAVSFLAVASGLLPYVDVPALLSNNVSFSQFLLVALPVYVTAFACAGLVPSLVRHYHADREKVRRSLLWGTVLALLVYLLWLAVTFGVVGRAGFEPVLQAGGNTADLVQALVRASESLSETKSLSDSGNNLGDIDQRLMWFSHCAIITSFLAIGLGLFHFIQDKFGFGNRLVERLKAVALCFLPPAIASFFYPKGFLVAIGYAGLFVSFSFFIVPAMMAFKPPINHSNCSDSAKHQAENVFDSRFTIRSRIVGHLLRCAYGITKAVVDVVVAANTCLTLWLRVVALISAIYLLHSAQKS